jgi:hypothetical protein
MLRKRITLARFRSISARKSVKTDEQKPRRETRRELAAGRASPPRITVAVTRAMPGADSESSTLAGAARRRPRLGRVAAILVLAAALSPGLWWRSPPVPRPPNQIPARLVLTPIDYGTPGDWPRGLEVVGAWQLNSGNRMFGGYSALLTKGPHTLIAYSDDSTVLRFTAPGAPADEPLRVARVPVGGKWKSDRDLESATADPATGRRWFGFEENNRIERFDPGVREPREAFPPAMADWPANGGPESMTHLPDGRFIVLREVADWLSSGGRPGLLFPGDPVEGARPVVFGFRPPIGYDPSDMAALPDGRVLILLRALNLPFPPLFRSKLVIADPRQIAAGKPWPWRELATFHGPVPRDNYEGLAVVPDATGVTLWLISDDNKAPYQRTLLLKLHWRGGLPPAVSSPRRPS